MYADGSVVAIASGMTPLELVTAVVAGVLVSTVAGVWITRMIWERES